MLLLFQESMGDLHDPRSVELERAVTDATIHSAKKENTITFLTQHLHMFLAVPHYHRHAYVLQTILKQRRVPQLVESPAPLGQLPVVLGGDPLVLIVHRPLPHRTARLHHLSSQSRQNVEVILPRHAQPPSCRQRSIDG